MPRSRPVPDRRQPLSRDRIVSAALNLVDRRGLEALSMRALGRELGVEAMSLYKHVPNKAALLDGIVETILSEVVIPSVEADDWAGAARALAGSFRRAALAHPNALSLVVATDLLSGPVLQPGEAAFAILHRAGFDEEFAFRAYTAILSYAVGAVLMSVATPEPAEIQRRSRDIETSGSDEFRFQRWGNRGAESTDPEALFDFGLDLLVRSLQAMLDSRSAG